MSEPIKVLLADDHAILRAGLRMLLNAQPDMAVVGEATDGLEALQKTRELQPDVVLMDITMPGPGDHELGGLEATRQIKAVQPRVKVLVLTMHQDEAYLRQFLEAGASGYVVKKAADTELTAAIRAVHQDEVFLSPSMAKVLVKDYLREPPLATEAADEGHEVLSERETEVLKLVALGYTNQEIARRLYISVKTVETHKTRIMGKLQASSRAELVQYALQQGLLDDER